MMNDREFLEALERRKEAKECPCDSCYGTGRDEEYACSDCLGQGVLRSYTPTP